MSKPPVHSKTIADSTIIGNSKFSVTAINAPTGAIASPRPKTI